MKRNVGIAAVVVLAVVIAILVLRPGSESAVPVLADGWIASGRFSDDSLGVILVQVPPERGWRLSRGGTLPGSPVVSAATVDGDASWNLYVTEKESVNGLDDVVRRRRDQLASLFGVSDIDLVVAKVLNEDVKERDGYPAIQWQAITKPVDVAGGDPIHVMFLWVATLRGRYAYEGVGLLRLPVNRQQGSAATDSLLGDVAFILESMQFE